MKNICIIGTGYVGLVTGTCFADLGNRVTCIDIDEAKIAKLKQGIMPIYEPGLEEIVRRNTAQGRLRFTLSYEEGIREADFIFICVDTPSGAEGEADLHYVRDAARGIGGVLDHPVVIVNRSTVPIGTGDIVANVVRRHLKEPVEFAVVSNPEFTREGSAINDFLNPDRVVLGATDRDAAEAVAQLYLPLRAPIIITDLRTAEMIKYASNAFLATRLSFINEIASICEQLGADIKEVAAGMGYDKRIGHDYLDAGIGWGGSCFAADESTFTLNGEEVVVKSFAELFAGFPEKRKAGTVEVVAPVGKRTLAFDLDHRQPTVAEIRCLTRRWYEGEFVTIRTRMGQSLRLTADHPVVLYEPAGDTFRIALARDVQTGDHLMAVESMPSLTEPAHLNLLEKLQGSSLENSIQVRSTPVLNVEREQGAEYVYSMETTTGTLIASSGLVCHNCFPKDVKALAHMAAIHGTHPQLLRAVLEINRDRRRQVIRKLRSILGQLDGATIGVLGLSFKPNTDDMRESPAVEIIHMLQHEGALVKAYDPVAMDNARRQLRDVHLCEDPYHTAEGSDALVIATEWNEFKQLDLTRVRSLMRRPVIIDGRNIYEPDQMAELGFIYQGMGRGYSGTGRTAWEQRPAVESEQSGLEVEESG